MKMTQTNYFFVALFRKQLYYICQIINVILNKYLLFFVNLQESFNYSFGLQF